MTINLSTLSLDQLKRAVVLKEQIAALESELAGFLGGSQPAAVAAPAPGKRSLSEATKAKMRAAHQARWAKIRAGKSAPKAAPTAPKAPAKRKMTAVGRAAIAAGARARWAKVKAAKAAPKTTPTAPKAPVKRKMSAAGRARLVAAVKARWARVKAEKK